MNFKHIAYLSKPGSNFFEIVRFAIVGSLCLAVDILLLLTMTSSVGFFLANLVSTLGSTCLAFFLHLYFTFKANGAKKLSLTASKFIAVTILLWSVNYVLSSLLIWQDGQDVILIFGTKTAVVLAIGFLRFILLKGFVFR
jgi:putative flippase GtrA